MKFSEKLQKTRKEKKMSQEQLADALNLSRQAISKWESGQNYPDIENLILLSDILGVTVDDLVKDDKELTTEKAGLSDGKYIVVGMCIGMALSFITGNYMLGLAGGAIGLAYAMVK